jgi:hypothetical protein
VLSPAAYFVDLLQFIRNASPNAQLLDRLMYRRPDLQDIELTCGNSHTEVPAIDHALEILENAVALPLSVDLAPGATLDQELQDKQPVGAAIRTALERTVRSFAGEGRATWAGMNGDGSTDWTVTDRHRRWILNAQAENALTARDGFRRPRALDTEGLDVSDLIRALHDETVSREAEAAFARMFAPNQKAEYSDYQVTVTPQTDEREWRVAYRIAAELAIDDQKNELTLRNRSGKSWSVTRYDPRTIGAIQKELADGKTPKLVRVLITARFPDAGKLTFKSVPSRRTKVWAITAEERELTLSYTPAHLNIISLAYQSGDPV